MTGDDPTEFSEQHVETGLVTATVNQAIAGAEEMLSPEAIQAAKALVNMPEITPVALAQLAREIAQDIGLLPVILQKHKLSLAQYEFIEQHNKFFKNVLATEIQAWQGIKSTEVRLRLQAQAALEQQMPVIANRMGNAAEKLGDAVEAFKTFARIAGVDAPPAGAVATGERYTINIDLGADTRLVIGGTPHAPASAEADVAGGVSTDKPRSRDTSAARAITTG